MHLTQIIPLNYFYALFQKLSTFSVIRTFLSSYAKVYIKPTIKLNIKFKFNVGDIFFSTNSIPPWTPTRYAVTHLYPSLSPIEGGE